MKNFQRVDTYGIYLMRKEMEDKTLKKTEKMENIWNRNTCKTENVISNWSKSS